MSVDGDRLLVLAQKSIIDMAKRVTKDVYPLYYEMKKANAKEITPESLYEGLILAFTGGRIGPISNDITKIWNSGNITDEAKYAVKVLCAYNNFVIDYAKTLFKPTFPPEVVKIIKQYTKAKTPYFFMFAKDKMEHQVELPNNSVMNRITASIEEKRIKINTPRNLSKINVKLMANSEIVLNKVNQEYDKWNRKYGNILSFDENDGNKSNKKMIKEAFKSVLSNIEPDENKVADSLVNYLYSHNSSKKKKLLWYCYGDIIYNNLINNLENFNDYCYCCGTREEESLYRHKCLKCRQKEIKSTGRVLKKCVDCGEDFIIQPRSRSIRCDVCKKIYEREKDRLKKMKKRKRPPYLVNIEKSETA